MGEIHRLHGGPNLPGNADVIACLEEAKREAIKVGATKAIVILIDDSNPETYRNWGSHVGMVNSEKIGHLTIMVNDTYRKMQGG